MKIERKDFKYFGRVIALFLIMLGTANLSFRYQQSVPWLSWTLFFVTISIAIVIFYFIIEEG